MNACLNVCLRSPFLIVKKIVIKFTESGLVWCTSHQTDKNQVPVSNDLKTVWGGNQSKQKHEISFDFRSYTLCVETEDKAEKIHYWERK